MTDALTPAPRLGAPMAREVEALYREVKRLKERESDLLEANNRYLERARNAEADAAAIRDAARTVIGGVADALVSGGLPSTAASVRTFVESFL